MKPEQLKNILEAALMVAQEPLNINQLLSLFEKDVDKPERNEIRDAVEQLQQDYLERGLDLHEIASGFRFQVKAEYAEWVNRLYAERPQRYSRALLETLAIIAYRQPVSRGEIEAIRGVSVSSTIIKTLQDREWIRVVGHRDVPGRPELLATSKQFLDYFNLKKLSDLPSLAEIKDLESINPDLFDNVESEQIGQEEKPELSGQEEKPELSGQEEKPELLEAEEKLELTEEEKPELTGEEGLDQVEAVTDDNVVPFSG